MRQIEETGCKEIVLTGVNLGDFGKGPEGSKKQEESFLELIRQLDEHSQIDRFRISSIEPNLLSPEIIEWVAGSQRFMPHFHVPLQSGSPAILRKMRRRYTVEEYADRIHQIKKKMPHAAIGADVIVGFPGETDAAFQQTVEFLHQQDVSYLHVFTYSEREHTDALELPNPVPQRVRNERNKILRNLSFQKEQYFESTQQGQTRWVLFESANREGILEGYTDNYIRVKTPFREEWKNTLVPWTL